MRLAFLGELGRTEIELNSNRTSTMRSTPYHGFAVVLLWFEPRIVTDKEGGHPPVTKSAASPNPWKSRFALNFKNISYKTTWVPLLDISSVRGPLDIPASRKFADGSPYHTLPILSDPATGRIELEFVFVHDMGPYPPIAEAQVSDGPAVAYAKFNTNVDALFKERIELFKAFEEALGELAKLYTTDATGPFILGTRASYADFIVGGWLRMSRAMLPGEEWEALKGWHGGVFGRLDEALEVYSQMN
ncbi:Glutathione S-transferase/chloride channel C-terminal [Penicillium expansum]|nr:Glutathione S-transferase/chloride channel C-terminal [Penicillium expansum]